MEMLEAFDLTGSLRDAAELAGCSHHTVGRYVRARDAGGVSERAVARPQLADEFWAKLEEWMERSKGKIRADVAHEKLAVLGYRGSERTTRRAVARVRAAYKSGRVRVHRPSVTARSSTASRRCCSARGWPGPGSGWCSRCGIRRCPACSRPWT